MTDSIRARLGSIPDSYLRTLRPSVQRLLRVDLPALLALLHPPLNPLSRPSPKHHTKEQG